MVITATGAERFLAERFLAERFLAERFLARVGRWVKGEEGR